jgi:hypothetical protein
MTARRKGWASALTLAAGVALAGCQPATQLAVVSMLPILQNTADAARERSDLAMVGAGLPANLLLLDGLIRTAPQNADLLALGSYLYFGY